VQPGANHIDHVERPLRAGDGPLPRYHRREPEQTLLHATVRARLEPFLAAARRTGSGRGLPGHVERELRSYLDCGILARGFARVRCPGCGFERLVAFSCKESICPSCATRRMEDVADHLCRNVLPIVPVRQWVLSLPLALRFQAARESRVASRLLDLFTRAVFAWQRRAARRTGVVEPRTGGVTLVQRFGGAINLNVHFHTLVPDGVFAVNGRERARFIGLPAPDDEDVERILTRVIKQVHKAFPAPEDVGGGDEDDPFAALQAAEVDRRLRFPDPFRHARRSAHLDGFSLHAGVRVHEHDRVGLERLCRYAARPPFALHRLTAGPEGKLVYRMKRPRGGSLFLLLMPDELLARIATLVPPPRAHALRYHGVFAPNSRVRAQVVPEQVADAAQTDAGSPRATSTKVPATPPKTRSPDAPGPTRTRVPWAELLQKVFAVDVLACPRCAGRLEVIAYIAEPRVAKQILDHLGLEAQAPPLAKTACVGAADPAAGRGPAYDLVYPS
jgi:hypothetical protein